MMLKEKASIREIAHKCLRSYSEIENILYHGIFVDKKPHEEYMKYFYKKHGEYYLKPDAYTWFQERILIRYYRVKYIGTSMVLGHEISTFTDDTQKFYDADEVCNAFGITHYELYKYTNFFDVFHGIILNKTKDRIRLLVTEWGIYLFFHLFSNDRLQDLSCA